MTQRKPKGENLTRFLTGEQKAALGKFQQDFQTVLPQMQEMGRTAQTLHRNMIDAKVWKVAEGQRPPNAPEEKPWSVGHAKVNYVDHIEVKGAEDK